MVDLKEFAEPYTFKVHMKDPRTLQPREVDFAVPVPHEILTSLWEYDRTRFERCIASFEKIERYWSEANVTEDPCMVGVAPGDPVHPLLFVPGYERIVCPMGVHVDGAPFLRSRAGITTWSISSLLGVGRSIDTRIVGAVIPESVKRHLVRIPAAQNTVRRILKVFVWSLKCLKDGVNAWRGAFDEEFDPSSLRYKRRGMPIAGGMRFYPVSGRADLKAQLKM